MGTWNTGVCPISSRATMSAVTVAASVAAKTWAPKSRCISSSTNTRPASGALKAADSPAPAPAAISVRRSRGVARSQPPSIWPTAPPICTVGPSRPSARPPPMASTPPANLTGSTRAHASWRR